MTESEIASLRRTYQLTLNYLDAVIEETIKQGGSPKGEGVERTNTGQILHPGIPRDNSELRLVRTLLLAEEAEKMGMEVPDEAIVDFLAQLSDRTLSSTDLRALLIGATNGQLTRDQLFETLRRELLARNYLRLIASGDVMTPRDAWSYYNRTTRRIDASLLEFRAEDYLDRTPQPSATEVREFYEKYKEQYPYPGSPEPGFKQRPQYEFAYFKADFDKFMEEEKAKIPAEEVQKYYEENKESYVIPELPQAVPDAKEDSAPAAGAAPPTGEAPTAPAPGQSENAAPSPDATPAEPPSAPSAPKAEAPSPSLNQPAPAPDADAAPAQDADAAPAQDANSEDAEAAPAEDESAALGGFAFQAVAFLQPEAKEEADPSPDEAAAPPATDEPASPPEETAPAAPAAPEAPALETSSEGSAASTPPAETSAPAQPQAAAEEGKDAAPQEVRYRSLEEVEDDIRRLLASQRVSERMREALTKAQQAVERYRRAYNRYQTQLSRNAKATPPEPPDFEQLAQELGLEYDRTPLVDQLTVDETELGQTFEFDVQAGFQQIPFAQIAMRGGQAALYQPRTIGSARDMYLYWATRFEEERTPPLEEIRDEVVRAWRLQKAFEIALEEARQAAQKIRAAKDKSQPLHELAGVDESKVIQPPAFSWMTTGAVAFGGGAPYLSDVEGVDNPGPEFMEEAFRLKPGEVGVAPNQPRTAAYVIRVEGETPGDDIRRELFWQGGIQFNFHLQSIAQYEQQRKIFAWLEELEREWGLEWKRPPQNVAG